MGYDEHRILNESEHWLTRPEQIGKTQVYR